MAFCTNCGKELAVGAKFCANCGAASGAPDNTRRNSVYDGEMHKCPSCGELLKSFTANCPVCGFELRGTKSSHMVTSFAERLENAKSEEHRISLIRSFPVPNTKEDILEFMILASSNFDTKMDKATADAWFAKVEQCYQKGALLFKDDPYFTGIKNAYNQTCAKIKNRDKIALWRTIGGKVLHTCVSLVNIIKNAFLSIKSPILRVIVIIVCFSWVPIVDSFLMIVKFFALFFGPFIVLMLVAKRMDE